MTFPCPQWPFRLQLRMLCESCGRAIFSRRSSYCIPCAATATLQEEFKASWGSDKLRVLAGDIAVSAARHIRGLRVAASSGLGATPKSAPTKPQESRARSRSPRRPLLRRVQRARVGGVPLQKRGSRVGPGRGTGNLFCELRYLPLALSEPNGGSHLLNLFHRLPIQPLRRRRKRRLQNQ